MLVKGGFVALIVLLSTVLPVQQVSAAKCANVTSFGAVSINLPELKKTNRQALWIRMQAPAEDGKALVEINESACLEVGGQGIKPDTWTWQTWRNNGQVSVVNFRSPKGNVIKVIGVSDGLKIDRILLTDAECTPEEYGNNCRDAVELKQGEIESTILPSPSNGTVSGKVQLSSTPQQYTLQLKTLEYIVKGKVIQKSEIPEPFDTSLLENGKYEVIIRTTLSSGEVVNESTVLDIKNPENAFTPVVRWAKLNIRAVRIAGIILGSLLAVTLFMAFIKKVYLARRERKFHGF